MNKILVSICLPTYNRPDKVCSFIENISSFKSDKIELLIGDDNPSSLETQNIIKKY